MQDALKIIALILGLLLIGGYLRTHQGGSMFSGNGFGSLLTTTPAVPGTSTGNTTKTSPPKKLSDKEKARQEAKLKKELDEAAAKLYKEKNLSPYIDWIKIDDLQHAQDTDYHTEYLTIKNISKEPRWLPISDWTIESLITGQKARLGAGAQFFYTNHDTTLTGISLGSGEKAIIHTAYSPLHFSFRENICTGYLNSSRFTPPLAQKCPAPSVDAPLLETYRNRNGYDDNCLDYIESLPKCERPDTHPDNYRLTRACRQYLHDTYNYNGCVALHGGDVDFLLPTWHIYLNSSHQLWKLKRDVIVLKDETGKIITAVNY